MKLTAKPVAYSSVVGSSVSLLDENGQIVALVMISVPNPKIDYRSTAEPIIEKIVAAFNDLRAADGRRYYREAGCFMTDGRRKKSELCGTPSARQSVEHSYRSNAAMSPDEAKSRWDNEIAKTHAMKRRHERELMEQKRAETAARDAFISATNRETE